MIDTIIAMDEKPSPRQQLFDGVFAADVICSNDFVLVLKLSANYKVACVSFHTADKLVEREWGLIRTDKTILGGTSVGCSDYFEIFYDSTVNFRESQLLKQMRMTLSEFNNEITLWSIIQVSSPNNEGIVEITTNGFNCLGDSTKILHDLKELEHVIDAKNSGGILY